MTDDAEARADFKAKLDKMLEISGLAPGDLVEQPDDRIEEEIDEWERVVDLLSRRGHSAVAPLIAAQLLTSMRLDLIETAILSFDDTVMLYLETRFGKPNYDDEPRS